jgi:hypothetical protein
MTDLKDFEASGIFEEIKRTTPAGMDYWRARELQEHLGYDTWENFEEAISRASEACERAGVSSQNQFRETTKMVMTGSGAKREVRDFFSLTVCLLPRRDELRPIEGQGGSGPILLRSTDAPNGTAGPCRESKK